MLEQLTEIRPDWEHGVAQLTLAQCYESERLFEKARAAFERAVAIDPDSQVFVGTLASHLFMHGDPKDAFQCFAKLYALERFSGAESDVLDSTLSSLRILAERAGIELSEVERIRGA